MTEEEKKKRLEELRQEYKNAKTDVDRKILKARGILYKWSIKTLL